MIPPSGLPEKPTLWFSAEETFPRSSTCLMFLTLPTRYTDYDTFQKKCSRGFKEKGFAEK